MLAELVPTPKLLAGLRPLFPRAKVVGWKYEVEGEKASVLRAAEDQLRDCRTDACVANGRAYGLGFGLVTGAGRCEHFRETTALFEALEKLLRPQVE